MRNACRFEVFIVKLTLILRLIMPPCVKLALVGAGRVAQHYKLILDSGVVSGFQVVSVCDVDDKAAKQLAKHWGCSFYNNIKEAIEISEPDLVVVLTPSGLHYEHTLIALEHGCNVLVEKPIAMRPSQIEHLIKISNTNGLLLCVAFQNRLNPAVQSLRNAVVNNRFGQVTTATIRLRWCRNQSYYEDGWHGTWNQDGGVINQQAIHHVDVLQWLMGPIDKVCALTANRINVLEAEDTLVAVLQFENGALGTIEATTAARPVDLEASISIVGEKGVVVIDGIALNKIKTWNFIDVQPEDAYIPILCSVEVPNGYGLSHGPLLQEIISICQEKGVKAPVSADDGLRTCRIIHALYASVELGGWVSLRENPLSEKLGN